MALAGLRLRDRLRLLPRRPCWVRTAPWCSAGVGTAARLPPSGFLHIFCSASTAWHPLLLLVLTGLASGFYSVFTCFFGGKLLLLLLPASTGITLRVHVLVAEDRSYRLHSRCPSSAAAPASSPTSASGFSALAGSLVLPLLVFLVLPVFSARGEVTGGGFRPGAPRRLAAGRRPCGRSLLDNGTSGRFACYAQQCRPGSRSGMTA